jgi:hypothetical protein
MWTSSHSIRHSHGAARTARADGIARMIPSTRAAGSRPWPGESEANLFRLFILRTFTVYIS